MADLLGEDYAVAMSETLYRCLDKLGRHKDALFVYLKERWMGLFQAEYDILLYDLTSTYFECDVPVEGKRRFGHSRDRRSDCVQVVIALIVTTDGLPVAYEVMQGNTSDKTTLLSFLEKIEKQYGQAQRLWLMDRGIPTEESLEQMRKQGGLYLVGTPRDRLKKLERSFLSQSWDSVRDEVAVKLVRDKEELYVLTRSLGRRQKERGIRKRKLKKLWARLKELQEMKKLSRDELRMKLGAAKKEAGRTWNLGVPSANVCAG
jgi:transposase